MSDSTMELALASEMRMEIMSVTSTSLMSPWANSPFFSFPSAVRQAKC